MSRLQKRRELKKQKRKQQRRQAAIDLSDLQQDVDEEALIREEEKASAKERAEHEEQERLWLLREEEAQKEWLRKQEEAEAARKVCDYSTFLHWWSTDRRLRGITTSFRFFL